MLTIRPRKIRIIAWSLAVLVVVAMVMVGVLLKQSNTAAVTFRTSDQLAMIGLGLILAGAILVLTRPYVRADVDGVVVRNLGGVTRVPWQVVKAVRFTDANPWATLELQDDDALTLLAIQAVDGAAAAEATENLRRMLNESRAG